MKRLILLTLICLLALALGACGSMSKQSICEQWQTHALAMEQRAWKQAEQWTQQFVAPLPQTKAVKQRIPGLIQSSYNVNLTLAEQADAKNLRWQHIPADCTAAPFRPMS